MIEPLVMMRWQGCYHATRNWRCSKCRRVIPVGAEYVCYSRGDNVYRAHRGCFERATGTKLADLQFG